MLKYAKIHQHRLCDYHELVACFGELCSAVGKKNYYTAKRQTLKSLVDLLVGLC